MQSEKRYNIYLKSKDDKDQLRRGLNNMINQMVGDSQSPGKIDKLVLKLAETLIILDVNTIPSRATLKRLLEENGDRLNSEISEEDVIKYLKVLSIEKDKRKGFMAALKTPQSQATTKKKEKKRDQDTESDAESEEEDLEKWLDNEFATSRTTQITKNKFESEDHLYQRMVTHADKLASITSSH